MNRIMLALSVILAVAAACNDRLKAWYCEQTVFWQVMYGMGAASLFVLLILRAFGLIDIVEVLCF